MSKTKFNPVLRLKLSGMDMRSLRDLASGALGDPDVTACAIELLDKRLAKESKDEH